MSDNTEETTTITPPPTDAALAAAFQLLTVMADPKTYSAKLRSFQEREAAAVGAEASQAADCAKREQHFAAREAAIGKREAEVEKFFNEVQARKLEQDERERRFSDYHSEVERREVQLKHRLILEAGLNFDPKIQSLPSFEELDRVRYGARDPHYDQPSAREGAGELITEPVPDSQTDRPPLMRGVPASRSAAARRSERRAAGPN